MLSAVFRAAVEWNLVGPNPVLAAPKPPGTLERIPRPFPPLVIERIRLQLRRRDSKDETKVRQLADLPAVLDRLQHDGFWLIDAVDHPVNKLSVRDRTRAIEEEVPRLITQCIDLQPQRGAIICHGKVYAAPAQPLRDAGVPVLHEEPLPFPLGNWRAQFVEGFRRAFRPSASVLLVEKRDQVAIAFG